MRINRKTISFILIAVHLFLFTSCNRQSMVAITSGASSIQLADAEAAKQLLKQISAWKLDPSQESDLTCLFHVQTKSPSHDICVVSKTELYQNNHRIQEAELVQKWMQLLISQIKQYHSLLSLLLDREVIFIRADDAGISKKLDITEKQVLFEVLMQIERIKENETIGYGFPSYPAYQLWFGEELVYAAPSADGLLSLFHNGAEYRVQKEKLDSIFGQLELPAISEQSLASLFGSQTARFLEHYVSDDRVDPMIRFLIQHSAESSELELNQLLGELVFMKQGKEEVITVYDQGFEYKGRSYWFPHFLEALLSAFTAG